VPHAFPAPAPSFFGAARRHLLAMFAWPRRRWLAALTGAVAAALAMGIPTGVVPTPFYSRMTPVTWWDRPIWAGSAALIGLLVATYVRVAPANRDVNGTGKTLGGGVLSTFAIGCPICNKIVVALLGIGGALNYWAPVQPFLGLFSVALLGLAFVYRLRADAACPTSIPVPRPG
jgi:hypothetical protein